MTLVIISGHDEDVRDVARGYICEDFIPQTCFGTPKLNTCAKLFQFGFTIGIPHYIEEINISGCDIEWANIKGNDLLDVDCSLTPPGILIKDTCMLSCAECIPKGKYKDLILEFVLSYSKLYCIRCIDLEM